MEDVPPYSVQDLLFFSGKELPDVNITGKRTPHRPIRLAIGINGVYKFEQDTDQLLVYWSFDDIEDWSFSGYSFTLNLKNKVDYHVRTNEGPSISQWIDSFIKSPDQAITASREYKSLGDLPQQPAFYTLSNRKKQNRASHADTQARLLSAYGVDRKPYYSSSTQSINSDSSLNGSTSSINASVGTNDVKRWSTGYHSAHDTKGSPSGSATSSCRSSSVDILNRFSVVNDSKAKSLEHLNNGTTPSPVHHHNGTDTPNLPQDVDGDSPPPAVPPRVTSLRSLHSNTATPPNQKDSTNVIIQVNDTDSGPTQSRTRCTNPHVYEEIEIGVTSKYSGNSLGTDENQRQQSVAVPGSDYDHLFPGNNKHKHAVIKRKKSKDDEEPSKKEGVSYSSSIRRNESLPPMTLHSPILPRKESTNNDSESISDSEMDEPVSPLPGNQSGNEDVVLRKKSNSSITSDGPDPFVDLLSAPPNKSRLRWSQELNPIYDYIKGTKISPKIGYDSLATTPENTIQEEDSNFDTTSICSSDRRSSSDSQFEGGLVFVPQSAPNTLQRVKRMPHNYEEVVFGAGSKEDGGVDLADGGRIRSASGGNRPMSEHYSNQRMEELTIGGVSNDKSKTFRSSPVRRLKSSDSPFSVTPQLNKRMIQRRSKTVKAKDDSNAPQGSQHARKVADTMRDFSYITRDYRVFYIKMPNGQLISEVANINKSVSILMDRLAELSGSRTTDSYSLFVEGAILTTMKEASLEFGELHPAKAQVNTSSVSLTQLVDNNSLADQGDSPILLKNGLSFRSQGITTARILRLDDADDIVVADLHDARGSIRNEFHKTWLSVVQGNQPTSLDTAVKLAAMQYQSYFLERTAENSVIGFCRPTEFLPAEFAGIRAIEGKIYKEQEKIKSKSQTQIQKAYVDYCRSLPTSDTLFFPVREARRRLLHSAKLKPILLGVNKHGIVRVCPKSKEVLESWEFQVLKNWAYSRRTFVIAFSNKNYPVESNQAKWISDLVDFHVHSIIHSTRTPPSN